MGGSSSNANKVQQFNVFTKKLVYKSDMLTKKYWHSLCSVNSEIYSLGGNNGQAYFNDCQKYKISQNIWSKLPNLQCPRGACASFSFNGRTIYVLGGCKNAGSDLDLMNTCEKLDIISERIWEYVMINNIFSPRQCIQAISIAKGVVLLFGGYESESYTIEIKEKKMSCKKNSKMKEDCQFYNCSSPLYDGGCVFAVDYSHKIHKYSVNEKIWSIIKLLR